jgi:hypothetical protein
MSRADSSSAVLCPVSPRGPARGLCTGCGTGFVIAFSCKGQGVCPSCNGRHMAQTAAHLVNRVIPPVPVREWVISVPKRLRCFLADRPAVVNTLTKIFIDEIERLLSAAAGVTTAANTPVAVRPRLGGISFRHRYHGVFAANHQTFLPVRNHPWPSRCWQPPVAADFLSASQGRSESS